MVNSLRVRRRGRPRKRWLQDVKDDLRQMRESTGIKNTAANCEGSQSPSRAIELRKKKMTMALLILLLPHIFFLCIHKLKTVDT
jgi:hypothetical protein